MILTIIINLGTTNYSNIIKNGYLCKYCSAIQGMPYQRMGGTWQVHIVIELVFVMDVLNFKLNDKSLLTKNDSINNF